MTITYANHFSNPTGFPINLADCLEFWAINSDPYIDDFGNYILYNYSGNLSANTEAQYNALTWTDDRDKPAYADLIASNNGVAIAKLKFQTTSFDSFTTLANMATMAGTLVTQASTIAAQGTSTPKVFSGSTLQSAPKMFTASATVASGVAVFQLTDNGLSTGNALFTGGPLDTSVNVYVSDATASYQMSHAWSNSNKTLTVTSNKLTTANILTGLLGQSAANGATVRLTVMGN